MTALLWERRLWIAFGRTTTFTAVPVQKSADSFEFGLQLGQREVDRLEKRTKVGDFLVQRYATNLLVKNGAAKDLPLSCVFGGQRNAPLQGLEH